MAITSNPPILVGAADQSSAAEVRSILEAAGHGIQVHSLTADLESEPSSCCGLAIVEDCGQLSEALTFCRRWCARPGGQPGPILVILNDASPAARLAVLEAGSAGYLLRPFAPGELLAHVQALLRLRQLNGRVAEQMGEMRSINLRLKQAYQQMDREMEAARRLQMSFLPRTLPEVGQARFAVSYRPCGRVGGDFYDVFRLDENHLGFYIADAMGHGVPASLLTIFLKRGIHGKEITGKQYRILPPSEVLNRLNRDLVDQQLPEMPFITMAYVLLNCRDGSLTFARAGHPHPVYVPRQGDVQMWRCHGGLLGVFVTDFQQQTAELKPGDKLLLYTDGLDTGASDSGGETGRQLKECATEHRQLPIEEYVPRLAEELLSQVKQADDFTLLGVELRE